MCYPCVVVEPEFDTDGDGDTDMEDAEELEDYFPDTKGAINSKVRSREYGRC